MQRQRKKPTQTSTTRGDFEKHAVDSKDQVRVNRLREDTFNMVASKRGWEKSCSRLEKITREFMAHLRARAENKKEKELDPQLVFESTRIALHFCGDPQSIDHLLSEVMAAGYYTNEIQTLFLNYVELVRVASKKKFKEFGKIAASESSFSNLAILMVASYVNLETLLDIFSSRASNGILDEYSARMIARLIPQRGESNLFLKFLQLVEKTPEVTSNPRLMEAIRRESLGEMGTYVGSISEHEVVMAKTKAEYVFPDMTIKMMIKILENELEGVSNAMFVTVTNPRFPG